MSITNAHLRQVSIKRYCFNASECSLFASSPMGCQCEVLSIAIADWRHVPDLINGMPNLRALTCFYEDNNSDSDESGSPAKDDVVGWLQEQLPSTCLINNHRTILPCIRVWIR